MLEEPELKKNSQIKFSLKGPGVYIQFMKEWFSFPNQTSNSEEGPSPSTWQSVCPGDGSPGAKCRNGQANLYVLPGPARQPQKLVKSPKAGKALET